MIRSRTRWWLLPIGALSIVACAGIPIHGPGNTVHHIIIGFGIVSYSQGCESMIVASRAQALGVNLSDRPGLKLGIGYSSSMVVTVPEGAEDVRVEISALPGGSLSVDAPSARGARSNLSPDPEPPEGGNACGHDPTE